MSSRTTYNTTKAYTRAVVYYCENRRFLLRSLADLRAEGACRKVTDAVRRDMADLRADFYCV